MDFKKIFKIEDKTKDFDSKDIEANKVLSLFSYLGILFLIPLLACKDSKFAKFHVNQGLKLWIISAAFGIVGGIISFVMNIFLAILGAMELPILTIFFALIMIVLGLVISVVGLGIFVISIIGIVDAVSGKARNLPLASALTFTIFK